MILTAQPLESCRNVTGDEHRHLRVIHDDRALCGAQHQSGAGGGTFDNLLRWPTCAKCRGLARGMGPHDSQRSDVPIVLRLP